MRSKLILRARILSGAFIFVAALLMAKLYFVQVINGEQYQNEAKEQYLVSARNQVNDRGGIFFTKRDGSLGDAAVMQTGWRVTVIPKDIGDPEEVFSELSAETTIDRDRFFERVAKMSERNEEIAYRVSDTAAAAIRAKDIPGLGVVRGKWRYYPGGELAAPVIGFVGF